jgi:non-ribosomal peptide synthase protein (TIGR01720 family)
MSLLDYVNGLAAKGVQLWVAEGKLQYKAPKDVLTPALLDDLKRQKAGIIELLLEFAKSTGTYPLSYAQKSLWSLHQLNPESPAYNVTYAARLVDDVDVDRLRHCFDYLIARHPILRTRYGVVDGQPQQRVETAATAEIEVRTLRDASPADIHAWIDAESNKPFDLAVSPIRLKVLVNEPGRSTSEAAAPRRVLLLNVHHIAADFWSLEIFVRELSQLYHLAMRGEALRLPATRLQYKDCVAHEIQRLQGPVGKALASFWEHELRGEQPILKLPVDHIRPPVKTENGRVHAFDLGERLTKVVKEAARNHRVTPYMLMLSVYQLFLFLHSGQGRILIGAPTAGRNVPGSEDVMGHFVNTAVLSCQLDREASFLDLLANTRTMMLRVLEHQDYPFPLLVERLRPQRDPSRSPLYQVMYNWNQAHQATRDHTEGAQSGLVAAMLVASSTGTRGATHDLTLNIYDHGARYETAWTYNTDLFQATTIARFAEQYSTLVEQVLRDATQPIADYALLDEEKRARALKRVIEAKNGKAPSPSIAADFVRLTQEQPERPALILNDRFLRYGDLSQAFLTVRSKLIEQGVSARSKVAIDVGNDAERALLAMALLDLNANLHIVADAGHDGGLGSAETDFDVVVEGSRGDGLWAPERIAVRKPATCFRPRIGYHATPPQLEAFVRGMQSALALLADSRTLCLTHVDQCLALGEFLGTLASGGSLHMQTELRLGTVVPDPSGTEGAIGAYIAQRQISTLAVPAILAAQLGAEIPSALDTLVLVGEGASPPPQWHARADIRLVPSFSLDPARLPISFAWRGDCWVLNRSGAGDPIGLVLGELADMADVDTSGRLFLLTRRRGTQLGAASAREYKWLRYAPADFVDWALVETPLIGKRTADHSIVYQGSAAREVTQGVAPFSLDAVEQCIAECAAVRQVACVVVQEIGARPALVAYVRLADAGAPDRNGVEERLRQHLKRRLAEHMHPRTYVFLDHLPITRAGSLDASRLPAPAPEARGGYVAPGNAIEEKLAAIWREVLALQQVSVRDNFFELGGDSILAAIIISKASAEGLYLSPKDIFENGSIADLARVVRSAPDVQVDQGAVMGESPLGPAQMWFFDRIETDLSHFNQALLLQLDEVPDAAVMEAALGLVVRQHDVLRARHVRRDGGWRLVYGTDEESAALRRFAVIPCHGNEESERQASYERAILTAQGSLDIERGELFKAFWLDRGSLERSRLLIVVHHVAIDGVSWSIVLEDLKSAYAQLKTGAAATLPRKTSSYKDWVGRLHDYANGASTDQDLVFWQQFAKEAAEVHFAPGTKFRRAVEAMNLEADAAPRTVVLDRARTAAFRTTAQLAYNTDANDLSLAALHAGFSAWNGDSRLLVDVEGHGRETLFNGIDLSRTVGWFTSIYPVLLDAAGGADKAALIKRVKQRLRDVPNKGFGYGVLRYLRTGALAPLPQAPILFTYLGQLDQLVNASGLYAGKIEPARGIRSPRQRRTHCFEVCAYINDGCLTIECTFDRTTFADDEIDVLLERIKRELISLIEHCVDPASGGMTPSDTPDIDIDQHELDQLLEEVAALDG